MLMNLRKKQSTLVNVRQAAEMLTSAMWILTSSTIENFWKKAGLVKAYRESQNAKQAQKSSTGEL